MKRFFNKLRGMVRKLIAKANSAFPSFKKTKIIDVREFVDPANLSKNTVYINYQGKLRFRCTLASGDIVGVVELDDSEKMQLTLPADSIAIDLGVKNLRYNKE